MTTATEAGPGLIRDADFEAFLAAQAEPDWIVASRRSAWIRFQELRAQPLDPEEFKRVDLRAFRAQDFALRCTDEAPADAVLPESTRSRAAAGWSTSLRDRGQFGGGLVHVDGRRRQHWLAPGLRERGVLFGDLRELLPAHRERLEPHLLRPEAADRFSAWHAALWTGGTVLYVPRGVELDEPLYSLIALESPGGADFSHTLVVLEPGASATLLEETASGSAEAPGLHVGAVELSVADGARLRYVQLQNWNARTWHFARQTGRVARDAMLQWTVGGIGARLAHIHQQVHLDGPGADAQVNGVSFATGRQVLSYYTQQTHHAARTRSDLLYKTVLRDESRAVWRGMIRVDRDAQKTDGYQRCDSLLLSPTARCDAIPGLEIEADDVRCTHGATAGRVDDEQVFYLQSRGMTRYEAMHLIVEGFFHGVYDRIASELPAADEAEDTSSEGAEAGPSAAQGLAAVRHALSAAVERKLGIGD